jgi:hypothetical protein
MLPMPLGWFDRAEIEPFYPFFGFKLLPACAILAGFAIAYSARTKARWLFRYSLQKAWFAPNSDADWAAHCYICSAWFIGCGTLVMILCWDFV